MDLMPTIEECEVIEEFRTRDDELDAETDDYPSYCDYDKKIHINCAHNLKFSCMIGFEFTHANFFPLLYVNVMSKKFHNSIMKDKMEYKWNNVIGALINVPIFVETFSGEPLITEYLVNISKRRAFWSLNEDILKITILTTNTPYPSRKMRRIRACTHQRLQRKQDQYAISREDQYAHFKTLSLNELRSPDFNLFSDQENSEEEVAETMAKTMKHYMSKTRADYGSGVARPKIEDKDNFELKGQFLKELRTNTFSSSNHEDANEHIEKVLEIVDLFHIPNITIDQVMLRAFPMSLTGAASRWLRNEPSGSITTWDGLKTKFLNKYCPPARTAKKMEEINNFQQEPDENLYQAWERFKELLMKYPQHYLTEMQCAIRNQGALIKTLEIQIRQMSKVLQERGFRSLPSSTKVNPRDHVESISTTIKADSCPILRIGSSQYVVSTGQNRTLMYETRQTTIPFPSRLNGYHCKEKKGSYGPQFLEAYFEASYINNYIPRKEKDPGSFTLPCFINNVCFDNALVDLGASVSVMPLSTYLNLGLDELAHTKLTVELADRTVKYPKGIAENVLVGIVPLILGRPFLSTACAKIDVYKRKITLRVGEERIVFTSVKPASSLIKRVYMLSLRERMELDLEARLMGETLVLNRSLDPFLEDYIELNDLNEPFELRRNQGDDLMPTIEEGKVIEEFRTRDDELDIGIDDYPSYCDYDKKIHIDCAHNLKFSCMIGFEFTHANFFPLLYVNVMSKKFHNSIMKEKMVYKGNNVVGALMNVPISVGTFSVVTDFAVLENMDAYRDEGMGDVIFGEPFLREVRIKARRFEGIITIYNGDDEVTYQMVRSHPRPIRRIHQGRYGVSVPALTKDHRGKKINTPYPEDQYAVLGI
ncbi:reverse transcriptase domain-containing protein [Tanacetum coccineum]